jgi:hypothetical protein
MSDSVILEITNKGAEVLQRDWTSVTLFTRLFLDPILYYYKFASGEKASLHV